jgi:hypothetical protein
VDIGRKLCGHRLSRDRRYDFFNIFAENFSEKIGVLTQNKAKLCKILIITLVFEKNAIFFRRKLSKIAENCDHNIDPCLPVSMAQFIHPLTAVKWPMVEGGRSFLIYIIKHDVDHRLTSLTAVSKSEEPN